MAHVKRYPFSARRHAHDIEFRLNRLRNEYDDKCYDGTITFEEIDRYEDVIAKVEQVQREIYDTVDSNGVAWLTGKAYGMAKECMLWAACVRG